MARNNIIDGVVAQLRVANGFEAGNTGTALAYDHRPLGMGVDRAAIVFANEGRQSRMVIGGQNSLIHVLDIELYIRHNNDIVQARKDADTYVTNIVTQLNANRALGGSAFNSIVTAYRVDDEKFEFGKISFLKETLTIEAEEIVSA